MAGNDMTTKIGIVRVALKHYRALKKFKTLDPGLQEISDLPENFVSAILDAGPTFIKLGQILSTRPDIMPPRYIQALSRLQENVPPFSFGQARRILEREFEKPLSEVFPEFNEDPEASASLAQVHFAVLHSGEPVAVKIQRPGVRRQVQRDMALIGEMIRIVVAELFKRHDLADVCFRTWCRLDFPLAERWGGYLERTNSIAGGAEICDFRWKINHA